MKHVFITTSAAPFARAPDFGALPVDPQNPTARLVPPDGRVSIAGEEWGFRDIAAIVLLSGGQPFPARTTGPRPTMIAPCRIGPECTFSVSVDGPPRSVIEEADEPPIVLTGFGVAKVGAA